MTCYDDMLPWLTMMTCYADLGVVETRSEEQGGGGGGEGGGVDCADKKTRTPLRMWGKMHLPKMHLPKFSRRKFKIKQKYTSQKCTSCKRRKIKTLQQTIFP